MWVDLGEEIKCHFLVGFFLLLLFLYQRAIYLLWVALIGDSMYTCDLQIPQPPSPQLCMLLCSPSPFWEGCLAAEVSIAFSHFLLVIETDCSTKSQVFHRLLCVALTAGVFFFLFSVLFFVVGFFEQRVHPDSLRI